MNDPEENIEIGASWDSSKYTALKFMNFYDVLKLSRLCLSKSLVYLRFKKK